MTKPSTDATTREAPFRAQGLSRPKIVWASLVLSLSLVGGLLLILEDHPLPEGLAMPLADLAPSQGSDRLLSVLSTRRVIDPGQWRGIVIHHSARTVGSPESITKEHEEQGLAGLGFHFIIGNGHGMGDGEIHVGFRWLNQLPGAHVAGPEADRLNRRTIGICLVGDGDRRSFTPRQLASLAELSTLLTDRLGIVESQVMMGRSVSPTSAPGRLFPEAAFREQLAAAE